MRHDPRERQIGSMDVVGPISQRLDLEQDVAAALLAGLDHVTVQLFQLGITRVDHAALGPQRHERGDTQLGQLLQQKLRAIALGQRGGHLDAEWMLALRRGNAVDAHGHAAAADSDDLGGVFAAVAVEQANRVAGAKPTNRGEVMRLWAGQIDLAGRQRAVDVIPVRHERFPYGDWSFRIAERLLVSPPGSKPHAAGLWRRAPNSGHSPAQASWTALRSQRR